ncbi:hypothetical protein O1L60_22325 [Streptomyces diastatochromogenes]|nr:hypothetical protein [Streptomyces diastatochromogenes]
MDTGALRIPLTGALSGGVVAGIVGDVVLYGVPGKAGSDALSPLYARNVKDPAAAPYKFLETFSSAAQAPDGSLVVRGATTASDGVFRISGGVGGARPEAELKADTGRSSASRSSSRGSPPPRTWRSRARRSRCGGPCPVTAPTCS